MAQDHLGFDDQGNPVIGFDDAGNPVSTTADQGPPEWQGPKLPQHPLATFGENALEMLNPMNIVRGAAEGWRGEVEAGRQAMNEGRPIAGVAHTVASMIPVLGPAVMNAPAAWQREIGAGQQSMREGRPVAGIAHTAASAIPILGPVLGDIVSQAESGDVPGAAGKAAGLAIGPELFGGAARAARAAPGIARSIPGVADFLQQRAAGLEESAAAKVAKTMTPQVGANKPRFGRMAAEVAPDVVKDPQLMKAWSAEKLGENIAKKFDTAEVALDEVSDARLNARSFDTQGVINDLLKRREELTGQPLQGSSAIPSVDTIPPPARTPGKWGEPSFTEPSFTEPSLEVPARDASTQVKRARPLGQEQVFAPNAAHVAVIDQAIAELKGLGPLVPYEELRKMRMAYDGPAKAIYHPSMTQDFLKAQGGKYGAADVTGALREHMAQFEPETAAANANYAPLRQANDVVQALAEVELTRPTIGRQMASRFAGAVTGGLAGGGWGALAGSVIGPALESALARIPPAYRLQSARVMSKLASAIRRGDARPINSLTSQLRRLQGETPTGLLPILGAQRPQQSPEE